MKRFVRWLGAAALGVVAVAVLQPLPAAATVSVDCGRRCVLQSIDAICWEKPGVCQVPIHIVGTLPADGFTVYYRTIDGRAVAPRDFTPVAEGTVTLKPGDKDGMATVSIVADDEKEPAEDFYLQFYTAGGKTVSDLVTITIQDGASG